MRTLLYTLAVSTGIVFVMQLIQDGPYGEIEAWLAAICCCVLLSGLAIVGELQRKG